jgi:hypothetical protein
MSEKTKKYLDEMCRNKTSLMNRSKVRDEIYMQSPSKILLRQFKKKIILVSESVRHKKQSV